MNLIELHPGRQRTRGTFTTEIMVALALLTATVLPLGFSFVHLQRRVRADYQRAVALELVDGEAEVLAAGAASGTTEGEQVWTLRGASVTQLPPGRFVFTRHGGQGRLEWRPEQSRDGKPIVREFALRPPAHGKAAR